MLPGPGDLHKVKPSQAGWRAGLKKKCGAPRRTSLVQGKWTALVSLMVVLSGCSVSEFIFPRNNVIRWLISLSPSPKLVGVFLWPRTEIWEGQRQKSRSSRMHSWQRAGRWAQRPPPPRGDRRDRGESSQGVHPLRCLPASHSSLCASSCPFSLPKPLGTWPSALYSALQTPGRPSFLSLALQGWEGCTSQRLGRQAGTQGGEPAGQGAAQLTFLVWKSLVREGSRTHKIWFNYFRK